MRISDWSSDVCSSDLARQVVDGVRTRLAEIESTLPTGTHVDVFYDRSDLIARAVGTVEKALLEAAVLVVVLLILFLGDWRAAAIVARSEEHTSELQSLMRISDDVFCWKKKNNK